jgi:hypothetical protein
VKLSARTRRDGYAASHRGFFEFKDAAELAALWAEFGDPAVAEWDHEARMPRARK